MRAKLSHPRREEPWRRCKQADALALTLHYTNATCADEPLSGQRIGRLHRLVDTNDRGPDTPLRSVERTDRPLTIARQPQWRVGRWLALPRDEAVWPGDLGSTDW